MSKAGNNSRGEARMIFLHEAQTDFGQASRRNGTLSAAGMPQRRRGRVRSSQSRAEAANRKAVGSRITKQSHSAGGQIGRK